MARVVSARLVDHFANLTDPRRRKVLHPLVNLVTIAVCAVLCGADDFVSIAAFGRARRAWFAKFLDLSAGIPSHDRFNAVFAALKPAEFERCLVGWISDLHALTAGQLVAVDGKTLRRSFDAASSKSALHLVSAWAAANQITLGQVAVEESSNELTAIPKLLELLELHGCLVTLDAQGCQTEIAAQIVEQQADYVLAVKGNQPTLHAAVEDFFLDHLEDDFARTRVRRLRTTERGHGRSETREYFVCPVPADLPGAGRWKGLKALGLAITRCERDGRESDQPRYYILSTYPSAQRFAAAVRGHWGIENRLHWQLDVSFGEDQSRLRAGQAAANFAALRRLALSLLKQDTTQRVGIKNKRLIAGWNEDYLQQVLFGPDVNVR